MLTHAPVLSFFNPRLPVEIETDASKGGLGACLLQNGHPVAFASRSLTATEQRYAIIEKEALGILFAVQKFHYFIYGLKDIKITTDHSPLVSIFKKDLISITPRLQRIRLRLLQYNLTLNYKPGKYMFVSDTLSRAFLNDIFPNSDVELEHSIHALVNHLPMSEAKKEEFRKATKNDAVLSTIITYISTQWPLNKNLTPEFVRIYHKLRENITLCDGLLFLGYKIIVPSSLRSEMLKLIHEGHTGIEKCKSRARQILYWPNMSKDIEEHVKSCKMCEKFQRKNCKETLHAFPVPERPWQRVGTDIFSYGNKPYLVLYDAYSNWLELLKLKDKSAKSVITKLKSIFARYGSPDDLICDNIPFQSYVFQNFSNEWNFNISTRSPNYPRSNGLAEKAVAICKNFLKKATEEKKDIYISLLEYRNSPLKNVGFSPSELFMNRLCKTKIPVSAELLKPKLHPDIQKRLQAKQNIAKHYFNRHARDLSPLNAENNVVVYDHIKKTWQSGKVVSPHETPRSYIVKDQQQNIVRRNRIDLRHSRNMYKPVTDNNSLMPEEIEANINPNVDLPSSVQPELPTVTRSGRVVRKPVKLDL